MILCNIVGLNGNLDCSKLVSEFYHASACVVPVILFVVWSTKQRGNTWRDVPQFKSDPNHTLATVRFIAAQMDKHDLHHVFIQ